METTREAQGAAGRLAPGDALASMATPAWSLLQGTGTARGALPLMVDRVGRRTLLALCQLVIASFVCGFAGSAWAPDARLTATWISQGKAAANTWSVYRKTLDIGSASSNSIARIAVDSKYWLYVNGRLVVREGGLKRGPTPTGTYYDEIDLSGFLTAGRNEIAVLAWYFGKNGFSHNDSGQPGLFFELDHGAQRFVSDASWRVRQHPAYGTAPPPHANFRLPESSLSFDARVDLPDWQTRAPDGTWKQPMVLGSARASPFGELHARPIPFWKESGLNAYVHLPLALPAVSDGRSIVARLPYNAQVHPYLKISTPVAGQIVQVRTDNLQGGGAPNFYAQYITRAGVQEYELPAWINGHEVQYDIPAGVRVIDLKYRETGYDARFEGSFESDDPALNALWQKARRTLYLTMRDSYMDCPDRERAQWWGDVVNELGESFYVFDAVRGPQLTRKAMLELAAWQRDDDTIYSPVPAGVRQRRSREDDGTWGKELPLQMLASVGWYGFATYYRYSGDRATIEQVYPMVRRYLGLWKTDPQGLVVHRAGDWDWADWGKSIDAPVLENAWYFMALKGAALMADVVGRPDEAAAYRQQGESLRTAFERGFWRGDAYRSATYGNRPDDRAQALAVVSGLADPTRYPVLRRHLVERRTASPYMEKYVLEALFQMGLPDAAIERMKSRYAAQIDSPLSTLWEGWERDSAEYGGGTYNHAWSGGPLTLLSQYAAGLSPTTPGWSTWTIAPQPGSLKHLNAVTPTPRGNIVFAYSNDGAPDMTIDVPPGTSGLLVLPEAVRRASMVRVDGRLVHAGTPIPLTPGSHRVVTATADVRLMASR